MKLSFSKNLFIIKIGLCKSSKSFDKKDNLEFINKTHLLLKSDDLFSDDHIGFGKNLS